ncbi:MAG TPA: hypothetical protein VHY08_11680 [Bacillota bacterium]|nr:hypothetical protein [Bacillota bacterium]
MSVPGESLLNIGLSFNGFGQLVQVQQAFTKTGQIVNGTVEYFKQCKDEFGKMAANMAATYNSPGKILNGVNKAFKGADNAAGALRDLYLGFNKDLGTIEKSLGKISPKLKQLISPITRELKGPIGDFAKIMENVQDKIQVAAKQFTKMKKAVFDVADSFKNVQNTVPAAFQVFQDPQKLFNPDQWSMAIFPAIDAIGQLKDSSINLLKTISNIPGIDKFTAKIGTLGSKAFSILKGGLMSVIPTVWSFTAALLANPVTWIVVGIIALGAAIFLLWKNWDKVVAWFKKGFQWLKDTLFKAPNWVVGLIAAFLPFIGIPLLIIKNWGAIVTFFKGIGAAIGSFFSSLWGRIVKIFAPIGNFIGPIISSLWNKLVSLFTNVFNLVGSILSKVLLLPIRIVIVIGVILMSLIMKAFEKIGAMLAALWGKVVKLFNYLAGVIGSAISSAWQQVVVVFNRIVGIVGAILGPIWNKIVSVFNGIAQAIWSVLSSVFNRIAEIVGPVLGNIWAQIVNVFTAIGNAIGALFGALWNNVVSFFASGISFLGEMIGGVLDFFNGVVGAIQGAFNAIWAGIESVFQSIGKMFADIVPDWAKGLFNWAINPEGNSPGKNAPNPAKLDQKTISANSPNDRQAANQLNQSQNNRTNNTKNTKVDKIEINLTGGKNDHQTAKVVRNELDNYFNQQSAATVGR